MEIRIETDKRRYAPIGRHLRALPSTTSSVTLTFNEIEAIIGAPLPASATEHHHQWWANQTHGSRAPHWDAAGFRVDHVDLQHQRVCFARKEKQKRVTRPMTLQEIVTEVNDAARALPIGELQEWRRVNLGFRRLPSASPFYITVKEGRDWVFHVGGLSELQFNLGFEEFTGVRIFRHGVAFSLQTTREMPTIEPLIPKIERFNEYLRVYPEAFEGLTMWHWSKGIRSSEYAVSPIPSEMVKVESFVFVGTKQPPRSIDIDWILDDFDRLLPLYKYVEGAAQFPRAMEPRPFEWAPGNKARAARTVYERSAQKVDKSLRHNVVQAALFNHLEQLHGADNTSGEQDCGKGTLIDVAVKTASGYIYYEIKTGLSAQSCIREALGQLMEYSYWPGSQKAITLVVVGEPPYDKDAKAYIRKLRKEFSLPIEYQRFDMDALRLV